MSFIDDDLDDGFSESKYNLNLMKSIIADTTRSHAIALGRDPDKAVDDAVGGFMRSKGYHTVTKNLSGRNISDFERASVYDEINSKLISERTETFSNGKYFFEDSTRDDIVKNVYSKRGFYDSWEK